MADDVKRSEVLIDAMDAMHKRPASELAESLQALIALMADVKRSGDDDALQIDADVISVIVRAPPCAVKDALHELGALAKEQN